VEKILKQYGLPTSVTLDGDWINTMKLDKKMQGDTIRFVFLHEVGHAFVKKMPAATLFETMKKLI